MQTISTTQLRTKSKDLVITLLAGNSVDLIHRSKVIGIVKPKKEKIKLFDAKKIEEITKKMNLPKLTYEEREKRYREHLMKKYGQGLPGHK